MNNIIILQGSSRDKQNNYCYADVSHQPSHKRL